MFVNSAPASKRERPSNSPLKLTRCDPWPGRLRGLVLASYHVFAAGTRGTAQLSSNVRPPKTSMEDFVNWFFSRDNQHPSAGQVIAWWELRRVPYNLIVGGFGLVSLLLFFLLVTLSHRLAPGEDAVEPLALFAAPIAINIAYTAGWVTELIARKIMRESWFVGPALLRTGMLFSLVVIALPTVIWFFIWLASLFR